MFEKVNPSHPDKVADRIAGAIVDYAYTVAENPHIAVEVLLGHNRAYLIIETDVELSPVGIESIVYRISNITNIELDLVAQDPILNNNQNGRIKCGDNGIFKGAVISKEQELLTDVVKKIYEDYPYDGKYLISGLNITGCQSHAVKEDIEGYLPKPYLWKVNPLGYWTGGLDVDSGATNRKLGSDMGDGVTGGGLHGKDLSKADVTLNICAFLDAQEKGRNVEYAVSIGDDTVDGVPYAKYVERAKKYIDSIGGFEKFAEWGLIR